MPRDLAPLYYNENDHHLESIPEAFNPLLYSRLITDTNVWIMHTAMWLGCLGVGYGSVFAHTGEYSGSVEENG